MDGQRKISLAPGIKIINSMMHGLYIRMTFWIELISLWIISRNGRRISKPYWSHPTFIIESISMTSGRTKSPLRRLYRNRMPYVRGDFAPIPRHKFLENFLLSIWILVHAQGSTKPWELLSTIFRMGGFLGTKRLGNFAVECARPRTCLPTFKINYENTIHRDVLSDTITQTELPRILRFNLPAA